ncbi:MAG: META domain-containing protein [Thermoplasmata archaeon]
MAREASLLVSAWKLLTFDSGTGNLAPPLPGTEVTAEFHKGGRLTGSAGCNRYGTTYETKGPAMTVNPLIAATQMWCGDPEGAMAQEGAFLQAWGRVASYSMNKERLELADSSGATILVFGPAPSEHSR